VTRKLAHAVRRIVAVLVVAAIATASFAMLGGFGWLARLYHPLSHQTTIARAAQASGVDPFLVAAVINVESGFREDAVSGAGAVGLMQIKPSTARAVAVRVGLAGPIDAAALSIPDTNIRIGTAYLADLIARYGGDVPLALAAYNAGITNADEWAARRKKSGGTLGSVIDYPATAHYVQEVIDQVSVYRTLYPDVFPAVPK
jgi:soluble lytic murein transglycosylase